MRTLAVVCNVVLFGFSGMVVMTDGAPTEAPYIALTLTLLLVPAFTAVVLLHGGLRPAGAPAGSAGLERAAAIANAALLAGVGAALATQPPHPQEEGYAAFVALALATPIASEAALLWRRPRERRA